MSLPELSLYIRAYKYICSTRLPFSSIHKNKAEEPTNYVRTSTDFAACYPALESFPPACCWSFIWRTLMR